MLGRLLIHIGQPLFNQVHGGTVHEIEIVAGVIQMLTAVLLPRLADQPLHRIDDAVDVFDAFFFGVGVVKAQVANTVVILGHAKVQADAFGVPNMQVAIGLGRKTGADFGHVQRACLMVRRITGAAAPMALGMGAFLQIGLDDLTQKVAGFMGCFCGVVLFGTHVPIVEAGALKIWRLRDIE